MNLFEILIEKLNKNKIIYAIAGRTINYPEKIDGDIDIIISRSDLNNFFNLINDLNKIGIYWIQTISHEYGAHFCVICFSDDQNHHRIMLDICSDYYRSGQLFLNSQFLLNNRLFNDEKGFYILNPEKEFIYYFLKKVDMI